MFIEIIEQKQEWNPNQGQQIIETIEDFNERLNENLKAYKVFEKNIEDITFLIQNNLIVAIIKIN
jgi:hypothetical protein